VWNIQYLPARLLLILTLLYDLATISVRVRLPGRKQVQPVDLMTKLLALNQQAALLLENHAFPFAMY
jgi:hypothetical protein